MIKNSIDQDTTHPQDPTVQTQLRSPQPAATRNGFPIGHAAAAPPASFTFTTAAPDSSEPYGSASINWTVSLDERDRKKLKEESGLSAEAIEARGYFTTSDRELLKALGFTKSQQLVPALVIPLCNPCGERAGVVIRPWYPRSDTRNGKPIKYELPAGAALVLDTSPLTRALILDKSKPLHITEGAKKADAAASRGLATINLNGVWGFAQKGGLPLEEWNDIPLRGRVLCIDYDSDFKQKRGVESAMHRLHGFLQRQGAIVKVVELPDGPKDGRTGRPAKVGLDDFFAAGGTVEELYSFARDLESLDESKRKRKERETAEKRAQVEADAKAAGALVIETSNRQQQDEINDLASAIEQFNARSPRLFHGPAGLVRVQHSPTGNPTLKAATRETVQSVAGKAAHWIRTSEREGISSVAPPRDLCSIFLDSPEDWRGVPVIEGTATAPFFAPDGSLCDSTGYHPSSRTWLSLPDGFALPDTSPTPQNIEAARRLILQTILGEVSFADNASRAHAVAQIILPFVRRLIPGPTPLHLWNAPLRGSGKSYAAELCIWPFALPTPTAEKGNVEEWRKSLFCKLATGPSHVFFDNVKGSLNSSTLDAMVTSQSGQFEERLTGTGTNITVNTSVVWVATANNAELTEDAATRSIVIQVDPNCENPETRKFQSDPISFIRENRGQVVGAVLTLVRAWQQAGSPAYAGGNNCRFPHWQDVIGGILETVQIPGFLDNLETERANIGSGAGEEWSEFAALWHEMHGAGLVSAKKLLPIAEKVAGIAATLEKSEGAAREKKLAHQLAKRRDRIYGGLKIRKGPQVARKVTFKVESLSSNTEVAELTDLFSYYAGAEKKSVFAKNENTTEILALSRPYSNESVTSATSVNGARDARGAA
jgi:hypothetical protein